MPADTQFLEAETPCPMCNGRDRFALFAFKPYAVVKCAACAFCYLSPRPVESEQLRIYEDNSYYGNPEIGYENYATQEPALRATYGRFLKELGARGLTGGSLLEVGCGYGFFLDESKRYFDLRIGTDFSDEAVKIASPRADQVYRGGIDAVLSNAKFDCIVAIQVIEHVYHPLKFLRQLISRLNKRGRLILVTPDMGSLWRRGMGRRWPSFKIPEHVLYFDRNSLLSCMRQAGLISAVVVPYPHAFPLSLVASKLRVPCPEFLDRRSLWIPGTSLAVCGTTPND